MNEQRFDSAWDALENTSEAAENMKVRSVLMMAVQQYVRESGATQAEAARRLGVTQPRLNDLLRGRIDKFSVDALINMLSRAGKHVFIQVQDAA